MDSARKDLFDKYMLYGGISAGVKQYSSGLDTKDLSDMNATDIALMKATHFVNVVDIDAENSPYVVDFEGCAKAFL